MKKQMLLVLSMVVMVLLSSCGKSENHRITLYDEINNKIYYSNINNDYFTIDDLDNPTNEKYIFLGWSFSKDRTEILIPGEKYPWTSDLKLYTHWKEKEVDYVDFFKVGEIAVININTNSQITSKLDYVNGNINIVSNDYELPSTEARFRLRGNSSLTAPKKSYKIKFDEKENIFNMGKDKEWALIANYYDSSLLRNYYAYKFALAIGIPYSIEVKFVELYLNGVDQGSYLFCETVKTGKNRIDIESDYKKNDLEIPFLLELDYKMTSEADKDSNGKLDVDYFILDNYRNNYKRYPIATKYPDDYTLNSITSLQYNYIKEYMNNVYNSVKNENYDEYIDIDSAIMYFLVEELFMNIDVEHSSVFMYKALDEKLKFGPIWDFDISTGNCNYVNNYSPYRKTSDINGGNYLFNQLMKHSEFREAFIKCLIKQGEIIVPAMIESFEYNYKFLKDYAANDNKIWNYLDLSFWPKPQALVGISYYDQVEYLKSYLVSHYNWMLLNI